jgi:hypothetical protein
MPIIFQICQVYNKVFYHNLNELACCSPIITLLPMKLFGLLQVLGGCKTEQIHRPAYHLFSRLAIFSKVFKKF